MPKQLTRQYHLSFLTIYTLLASLAVYHHGQRGVSQLLQFS